MESRQGLSWQARSACFGLALNAFAAHSAGMKTLITAMAAACLSLQAASGTTIMVLPIYEPLSLHDTDGDEAISDTGEALQACVMSRPQAITGAVPEDLVHAIRRSHTIPSNNDNYQVTEANLLMLADIGIQAITVDGVLEIRLNVSGMKIPPEVDLTSRQILNLTIVAIRKTLEAYQAEQGKPLPVKLMVEGTHDLNATLKELAAEFVIGEK